MTSEADHGEPAFPLDAEGHPDLPDAGDADGIVCANCMTVNEQLADFCENCGMPVSRYVFNDPFKAVLAQGWAYHRAVNKPSKAMLIGLWLIFAPLLVGNVLPMIALVESLLDPYTVSVNYDWPMMLLAFLVVSALSTLHGAILWKATKRYKKAKAEWETARPNDE